MEKKLKDSTATYQMHWSLDWLFDNKRICIENVAIQIEEMRVQVKLQMTLLW